MTIIACGQDDVFLSTCPGCEASYHRFIKGGVVGPHGWRYCEQACIDLQLDYEAFVHAESHRATRDLLCDCAEVCAPRGLPTQAMLDEVAAYRASIAGTPLDPGFEP